MGEAKRRGTFEERKGKAIIKKAVEKWKNEYETETKRCDNVADILTGLYGIESLFRNSFSKPINKPVYDEEKGGGLH